MLIDQDPAAARPRSAIDACAEAYLDGYAGLDPIAATMMGLPEHADRLTDYSPAGHQARADLARNALAELEALPPADDVDVVTQAALRERLDLAARRHEAGLDLSEFNNIACPLQGVREVFDLAPTATGEDWEAVAARLRAVPEAMAGYRAGLEQARSTGWAPARRQVAALLRQAEEFGAAGSFFDQFSATARLADGNPPPSGLQVALARGAGGATAAYADFGGWLREALLPIAREQDAVGPQVYALCAQDFLGARIDLAATYSWGLAELARIEDRMAQVAAQVVPGSTASGAGLVNQAVDVLTTDPKRRIDGSDAFRDWMQTRSDQAVEGLAGRHFDIPAPLRTLACRIAPSTAGGVYYSGPSEDFSRPGTMWWSVPPETTSFATWRETSTIYHEGVPGHHLQIAQAVYLSGTLNRWRRMASWVSGHGEGWALYAERLMEELGFLDDPGDLLGMLDAHALRACRVVVDIGVHLQLPAPEEVGGGSWDAGKAWAFLRAHTRMPDPSLRFELDRYLGWPGQAIAYKVGERVWLELREQVRERQGARFDLRTFHSRALNLGSVGLDVLREALLPAR
jgi:uncharacterized protein (DUF885 family)